jgi:hypothetical protein
MQEGVCIHVLIDLPVLLRHHVASMNTLEAFNQLEAIPRMPFDIIFVYADLSVRDITRHKQTDCGHIEITSFYQISPLANTIPHMTSRDSRLKKPSPLRGKAFS